MSLSFLRRSRTIVLACFAIFAVVGLCSFSDYGIPYDEGIMDAVGRDAYGYVTKGLPWAEDPDWRYHGTMVELPLFALQAWTVPLDDIGIFYMRTNMRRITCFCFFFFGVVALYLLSKRHFRDWRWALLTAAMLAFTPRFFAHGFYNSRDIPQMTFFAFGMFTLLRLLDKRTATRAIIHGIVCAMALALRMTAMLLPAFTILFLMIEILRSPAQERMMVAKQSAIAAGIYLLSLGAALYAFWPFLWPAPFTNFLEAYTYMSTLAGGTQEFLGQTYEGLPWHYVPVWVFVTVPLMFTLFFVIGFIASLVGVIRSMKHLSDHRRDQLLFLLWCTLPVVSLITTGAGIYNEWRHVFFLYPAFLLISVTGIKLAVDALAKLQRWPKVLPALPLALVFLQMASTGGWMILNHPFEQMYYSVPASFVTRYKFPLDYWALSYRQVTEFLLQYDRRPTIIVYSDENVAFANAYNLFPLAQARMVRTKDIEQAQYIMTRSREVAGIYKRIHAITVDGLVINGLYAGPKYHFLFKGNEESPAQEQSAPLMN